MSQLNIAHRLRESAQRYPQQKAVVVAQGRNGNGDARYTHLTFEQLDRESDRLARGLTRLGVGPGARLVLMIRPGVEFVALVFALFKAGAIVVLIDPGMGRANLLRCLEQVEPEGFIGIPFVQIARLLKRNKFPHARWNVTVGPRWFFGSTTYHDLKGEDWTPFEMTATDSRDPAAILFTSGSTGPPKGVLYEHGMFDAQIELIRGQYGIEPGEVDLSAFPLFALFNTGMGVTTVFPEMNFARPADVDPRAILAAISDHGATQAFGSPALWNRVGRYCEEYALTLPTVKRVLAAGAPVPLHVLARMCKALTRDGADMYTPYGATESLPVRSINGREVLERTAARTRLGAGTCVGRAFDKITVKIIEITQGPIAALEQVRVLGPGEIGEIIVSGPSVTREYYRQPEATRLSKIPDGERFWHRIGDVGYLDAEGMLWFCGRKAHVVHTTAGRMFPIPCEAIFNAHPHIYRSALVGVGTAPHQVPVIVAEPEQGQFPRSGSRRALLVDELRALSAANGLTRSIAHFLLHPSLPVDTRHNVKIDREQLAVWAEKRLKKQAAKLSPGELAALNSRVRVNDRRAATHQ